MATNKTSKTGLCNRFPRVWGAIFGCLGRGAPFYKWDRPTTIGGVSTPIYRCAACAAAETIGDAGWAHNMRIRSIAVGDEHHAREIYQSFLVQAQALAGVENYRYQGTVRHKDGRPGLINRRTGETWYMPPMHERWTDLTPVDPRTGR